MFNLTKQWMEQRNGRFLFLFAALFLLSITTWTITTQAAPDGTGFSCSTITDVSETECEALVDFYRSTDENGWTIDTNWLQTTAACTWWGVTCNSDNEVIALELFENNLYGFIPNTIGDLTHIQVIRLANNQLSSKMPVSMATLPNLEELDLTENRLSGGLPSTYTSDKLRFLSLGHNNFLVRLPSTWGDSMDNLENLDVSDNFLIGDIPETWVNMPSLKHFHFDNTYLCLYDKSDVSDWVAEIQSLEVSGITCAPSVSELNVMQQTAYANEAGMYMVNIPITLPEGSTAESLEAVNLVVEFNSSVSILGTVPEPTLIEENFYVWDFTGEEAESLGYVTLALRRSSPSDAAFQFVLSTVADKTLEINTTAVTLSADDAPPTIYLPFVVRN